MRVRRRAVVVPEDLPLVRLPEHYVRDTCFVHLDGGIRLSAYGDSCNVKWRVGGLLFPPLVRHAAFPDVAHDGIWPWRGSLLLLLRYAGNSARILSCENDADRAADAC